MISRSENKSMQLSDNRRREFKAQRGFTILELMVAVTILTIVVGVVTDGIMQIQKKAGNDIAKVGLAQESRQFMDQILRDLRQCGFPSLAMFDPAAGTTSSSSYVAQGLISFSSSAI